jgi:DNA-binding MarR family transcriptional regulator
LEAKKERWFMAKCVYRHGKGYAAKVKLGETRYYRGKFATETEAEAWVLQARAAYKLGHPVAVDGGGPRTRTRVGPIGIFAQSETANPFFNISGRLVRALFRLQSIYSEMTIPQAMCLFYIAQNQKVTQQSLYQDVGIRKGTATRTVAFLSHYGSGRLPALGLVDTIEDPNDRRQRVLSLTAKGKRLIEQILRDFERDWLDGKEPIPVCTCGRRPLATC